MRSRHLLNSVSGLVLVAMIDLNAPVAQAQSKIGVASAVSNDVAVGTRQLVVGNDVHANERVRTGDAGAAQLLFIDKTSLSIGPKSNLTLDRFVYDPSRGVGSVALSATRGSFRFVSGAMNPVSYTIKTPSATIGVRGTVLDIYSTPRYTLVIVVEGLAVSGGKQIPAGYALLINSDGTTQGPFKYDSTIINVVGSMSFPLFGNAFWGDPRRIELPDSPKDLVDQLKGIDLRNEQPQRCRGFDCKGNDFRANKRR